MADDKDDPIDTAYGDESAYTGEKSARKDRSTIQSFKQESPAEAAKRDDVSKNLARRMAYKAGAYRKSGSK